MCRYVICAFVRLSLFCGRDSVYLPGIVTEEMGIVQVRSHFRPEFVNRIDDFIVFQGLKRSEIETIARLQAKRVEQRLAAKKIKMKLDDSAVQFLAVSVLMHLYQALHSNSLFPRMA